VEVPNKNLNRYPRMLICEGVEDHYFFDRLIERHEIPCYHVIDTGGNNNIEGAISKFKIDKAKVFSQITRFVFVNDCDQYPEKSFSETTRQVEALFGNGASPTKPGDTKRKDGKSITILMMPSPNEYGHLERFCVQAARMADKRIAEIVDNCLAMAGAHKWIDDCDPPKRNESREAKARLRINLALRCHDPFVPLGHVFNRAKFHELIPVNDPSFKDIVSTLKRLAS
jgi:hypothetical protein